MHPKNTGLPTYLVREMLVRRRAVLGERDHDPLFHWYVFLDRAEAMQFVRNAERPGFKQEYSKAEYVLYEISFTGKMEIVNPPPITIFDVAVELGGHGVQIGLRGKGWDPKAVFWDSRGNSFVVVRPGDQTINRLELSDQGVLLMSINGIGEVRWTVRGGLRPPGSKTRRPSSTSA